MAVTWCVTAVLRHDGREKEALWGRQAAWDWVTLVATDGVCGKGNRRQKRCALTKQRFIKNKIGNVRTVSSVTKVRLVKWPYLCASRHRQRLLLSLELYLQISVKMYNKVTRISVRWEPNSRGRPERPTWRSQQPTHTSCIVRAYNPRPATIFLTSMHACMHAYIHTYVHTYIHT
jgi:hypothetical protein